MAININSKELEEILEHTPASQNIMLVGQHGIGKSEILTRYFTRKGIEVVTLFLGQMSDPGDLIGLPSLNKETGKTEFMPPYWFPMGGKPVVLFLDELNRARPEILQTIMDLALNRKLAGKELPQGSRLISAVNDGEEYQLTELDPALVSRFNIYNFRPTSADWLLWAKSAGVDERVTNFIAEQPKFLDGDDKKKFDQGLEKTPDRRAWKKVSDCIKGTPHLTDIHKKIIGGMVGAQATLAFFTSIKARRMLTGKDVLTDFEHCAATLEGYKLHELSAINESIYRTIETEDKSPETESTYMHNIEAYFDFLAQTGNKEAQAHFLSQIETGLYPNAVSFFLIKMPGFYSKMMDFIDKLQ